MKARKKTTIGAIVNSLKHYPGYLFALGCLMLMEACNNQGLADNYLDRFEEVEITNVIIEPSDRGFTGSIQLGEQVVLIGSYTYRGDDHKCHWGWSCTSPDGTRYIALNDNHPDNGYFNHYNSFPGEEVISINQSDCTTKLRFTPQVAGAYEIQYSVLATGWGFAAKGEESGNETFSFTVIAPTCQYFDMVVSPEEREVTPGGEASFTVKLENVSEDWEPHSVIDGEPAINFSLRQINNAGEPVSPLGLGVVNGVGATGGLNRENPEGSLRASIADNAPAGTYRFVVTPNGGPEEDKCFSNEFVIKVEEE